MMDRGRRVGNALRLILASLFLPAASVAQAPTQGGLGLQAPAWSFARSIGQFHDLLLVITVAIVLLVAGLMVFTMLRYNARANPKPASFSHNSLVEVIWTAGPVLILIIIALPSFPLLYETETKPTTTRTESGQTIRLEPEDWLVIKTYGRQWYWSYIYPDGSEEPLEFDSFMVPDADIQPGQKRNLSVDYPMVVPAGKHVNLLIAASDVIHSWAMPSFALKTDAIPGRLNEVWFKIDKPGIYYGQCSELCGIRHSFMPIEVRVLPENDYNSWYDRAKIDLDAANAFLNQIQPLAKAGLARISENKE